jgi:dTDP-glucose pyrophosphorylase
MNRLNIVIPMAGAGSRFATAGYADIKPLIPIHGTPMIKLVIDNLRPAHPHRFIFICQRAHVDAYDLRSQLSTWAPGSVLMQIDGLTEGAACTVLAAKTLIDNGDALMIANSDQFIDTDIDDFIGYMNAGLDGLIMTMKASDPKWSFAVVDDLGWVSRVAEKEVISDDATVGIYAFSRGDGFVAAAERMIALNLRVNGEFYVAPVYNQMIDAGKQIGIWNVGAVGEGMYGLGTPTDLELFKRSPVSQRLLLSPRLAAARS